MVNHIRNMSLCIGNKNIQRHSSLSWTSVHIESELHQVNVLATFLSVHHQGAITWWDIVTHRMLIIISCMCFVNSLIGTNAELNIHMRTNAIAHELGLILKLVRTFDIEIVISMKFSDFWLPPITCQHQNEKKTFSNIDPSRLVAIFSPSPRPHLVFYFSDVFVFSQFRSVFVYLDVYCLYHQSVLVAFTFVIINDYWICRGKRSTVRVC